jgi:transmembrane sensor
MKDYTFYTLDDFIQDDDFRDWVRGESRQEVFWLSFLERFPDKQDDFLQAERFIRATSVQTDDISEAEVRKETQQFMNQAMAYRPRRPKQSSLPFLRLRPRLSIRVLVVVVGLLTGIGWYFGQEPKRIDSPTTSHLTAQPLVETYNNTTQPLRVPLDDGSVVWLSPKSRLRYANVFARATRVVYLSGEATFSVQRRPQPFLVYSGRMITKVLGTRFVVRAFEQDRKMTVQVLSGKVSVYKAEAAPVRANKEVKGLVLTPNQAAIFEKSDGNLTKTIVQNPALVTSRRQLPTFQYEETPISQILRDIELSYGLPLQFDEQTFSHVKITADLSDGSLTQKLDLICKAASSTYEITDGQIIVSRR